MFEWLYNPFPMVLHLKVQLSQTYPFLFSCISSQTKITQASHDFFSCLLGTWLRFMNLAELLHVQCLSWNRTLGVFCPFLVFLGKKKTFQVQLGGRSCSCLCISESLLDCIFSNWGQQLDLTILTLKTENSPSKSVKVVCIGTYSSNTPLVPSSQGSLWEHFFF